MWYMPESDSSSSSEAEGGAAGLPPAALALGEGAALYL